MEDQTNVRGGFRRFVSSDLSKVSPEERGLCRRVCIGIMVAAVAVAVVTIIICVIIFAHNKAHYYAAIAAVSGLDPATDLGDPSLDKVEFTLALRIESAHPFDIECLNINTTVSVAYHGVTLAGGATANVCPDKWFSLVASTTVMARGVGVILPGPVLDSLASDMRHGVEAFDVKIQVPEFRPGTGDGKVVSCTGVPGTTSNARLDLLSCMVRGVVHASA